jgi:hypothetical protein
VIFIDAIVVKIRDGQVANRPVYAAIGVTVDGQRDIFGLWVGTGGEGAKYWSQVLTEIKNRGVEDACIACATASRAPCVPPDARSSFARSYASCRPMRITFDASSTVRSSGGAGSTMSSNGSMGLSYLHP